MSRLLFLLVFILAFGKANAQERVITAGIQFKPILPFEQFRDNVVNFDEQGVDFRVAKENGYAAGMVIRQGFTDLFSLEYGINFVARNYSLEFNDTETDYSAFSEFRLIAYELPVSGLVYIQLGDNTFMNASLGMNLSFFPSDVSTKDPQNQWFHVVTRRSFVRPGLSANLGWEYRTRDNGTFYIGGSWQSFFSSPYRSSIRYSRANAAENIFAGADLSGTYLTVDLRYFFHEPPQPKKSRKKKNNEVDRLWYLEKNKKK